MLFRTAELQLRQRQLLLRLRSTELRELLRQDCQPLRQPLAWIDRGLQGLQGLRRQPLSWAVLAVAAGLLLRRRRSLGGALGLAGLGLGALRWWRLAKRLQDLWRRFAAAPPQPPA